MSVLLKIKRDGNPRLRRLEGDGAVIEIRREQHLQLYLDEFSIRYKYRGLTDTERAVVAIKGTKGKRLTYRRTGNQTNLQA